MPVLPEPIFRNNKITPSKSFYLPKKLVMRIKNPFIHGTLLIKKSDSRNWALQ